MVSLFWGLIKSWYRVVIAHKQLGWRDFLESCMWGCWKVSIWLTIRPTKPTTLPMLFSMDWSRHQSRPWIAAKLKTRKNQELIKLKKLQVDLLPSLWGGNSTFPISSARNVIKLHNCLYVGWTVRGEQSGSNTTKLQSTEKVECTRLDLRFPFPNRSKGPLRLTKLQKTESVTLWSVPPNLLCSKLRGPNLESKSSNTVKPGKPHQLPLSPNISGRKRPDNTKEEKKNTSW